MQANKPRSNRGARCQGDDDGCYPDQDGPGSTVSLCGADLDDIPHLRDWVPDLQEHENPLKQHPAYRTRNNDYFINPGDVVTQQVVVNMDRPREPTHFRRAGPREKVVFAGEEVRAAIVTCGGLCPGLNTVVRELVFSLWQQYHVHDILGIDGGYRGFYAKNTIQLDPKKVGDIHKRGGTFLGTSRGGHETTKIVNSLEDRGINQVYIIGGDGTQRGALAIHKEVVRRGLKVAVAGIPKTIDNDIAVIDKSFGFDTAVEEAQRAINAAHVEAESVENGLGVVKLMGRYSGYIAMYATLASRDVDICLIPEVPFTLEGPGGLHRYVERRLRENGHMVIVIAEGAGQELMAADTTGTDMSGNKLLKDVGLWLSQNLKDHFTQHTKQVLNLKYIDPTYMIRAIPSNASDNVYCTLLAHSAVHGLMAGYTGYTVGPVNGRHAYIPIERVIASQNRVNVNDRMWARLVSSTQQPEFTFSEAGDDSSAKPTPEPAPEPSHEPARRPPVPVGRTTNNGAADTNSALVASMGGGGVGDVPPATTGTVSFDNDYGAAAQETAAAAMLEGARKDK
ncbi:Phosphofructokinase [Klebsormidium nitens]|uniref:ATP-dependent 6-phosphofructokinase n=1 Tax=Klebsormidium nitens TaxID=105231 RepID=A0A1Y1IQV5_KLENI|nr:Phosphofructokinase [Klebsormidium nitens]|eukprot:GAQ90518.1 Phosphofructokinase [Klebsormidium nitens]